MMTGRIDDRGGRARDRRWARGMAIATIVPMLVLPGTVLAADPGASAADEASAAEEPIEPAGASEPEAPDYVDIDAFVEQLESESGSDDPAWLERSDAAEGSDARTGDGTEPAAVSSAAGEAAVSAEDGRSGENAFVRAGEVTMDVLVLRPFGAVATVVGAGFFVASVPVLASTGNLGFQARAPYVVLKGGLDTARDVFVTERARYAFDRPLGQF